MAHFYGVLQGGRGETTRTGHKTTGISSVVKTWRRGISVWLYNDNNGEDRYRIEAVVIGGSRTVVLAEGKLEDIKFPC